MGDVSIEVPLPFAVEELLDKICIRHLSPPPGVHVRRRLSSIGEQGAVQILQKIVSVSTSRIKCVDAYIMTLVKKYAPVPNSTAESVSLSSPYRPSSSCSSSPGDVSYNSPITKQFVYSASSTSKAISPDSITPRSFNSPIPKRQIFPSNNNPISEQLLILAALEFRKFFLVLSYIGRKRLEDVITVDDANYIVRMTQGQVESMLEFESRIWSQIGSKHCEISDRIMHLDWDARRTHLYYCYVLSDGDYYFKVHHLFIRICKIPNFSSFLRVLGVINQGPYLKSTRTHLQRAVGDENVLIVKFESEADISGSATSSINCSAFGKIAQEGILVGLRRYRFFVFKDGGKVEITKSKETKKTQNSWDVKCYFIRRESLVPCDEKDPYFLSQKTVHETRCLFMHVHMVSSMVKYMARFSLILSQTIKHPVNLKSVDVVLIPDIPCHDENGRVVTDEDGQPLIHTDGTGFMSKDLALMCPADFRNAKFMKDGNLEGLFEELSLGQSSGEACCREPPLLIQCRLYHKGRAVKGTLLLNRKLKERVIQIRPSMVKVETDSRLEDTESFESLEIVAVSHKPRKASLSKNLILLLSHGGVPKECFLKLLDNALNDAHSVFSNKRTALQVSLNYGDIDDHFTSAKMILAGVPLNEPSLQNRLSTLANEETKGLGGGKLPISESFYLMGTTDPTGVLDSNQVCIILENGQISGRVLVYRNPGLHFGDVHILDAIYVKALEDFVGNAKYAIFFSTKGRRSVASEIANGDFDGDMYWVCRNPELLEHFRQSNPWKRLHSRPNPCSRKPRDLSHDEIERELFNLLVDAKKQRSVAGMGANTWTALMDRFIILGDSSGNEKDHIRENILELVDLYYDALDAPKTGKKVEIPYYLRVDKYPHYMETGDTYHSTSVLGLIYDKAKENKLKKLQIKEIWKLPGFSTRNIPEACMKKWQKRYSGYRSEMARAMKCDAEVINDLTSSIIKKYKQKLYCAEEFEESMRNMDDIYDDALALYHVTYDLAIERGDVGKCYFAWRVAGSALCRYYSSSQGERSITCSPSVLRENEGSCSSNCIGQSHSIRGVCIVAADMRQLLVVWIVRRRKPSFKTAPLPLFQNK